MVIVGLLVPQGCRTSDDDQHNAPVENTGYYWISADPHVGYHAETYPGANLEAAVNDIADLHLETHNIVLGDLVEDDKAYVPIFDSLMNTLGSDYRYVLGNHDFDTEKGSPVLPPLFTGSTEYGIRFIVLHDEAGGPASGNKELSETQISRFISELSEYRSYPVIVLSHQPPSDIVQWDDLKTSVSELDNIKLWFHGHWHYWSVGYDNDFNFYRVGLNSIGGYSDNDFSSVLKLTHFPKRVHVQLKLRNHHTGEWLPITDSVGVNNTELNLLFNTPLSP